MKNIKHRALGTWFAVLAGVLAFVTSIFFLIWAPPHNAFDMVIPGALFAVIALEVLLFFTDIEYIAVLTAAVYSIALFKLLSNSVGSFVDALQGIVMFGDSTQVGTILGMSALMLVGIVASILSCFMKRVSER